MLWLVVHAALPSLLLQQPATVLPAAFRAPEYAVRRCSTPLVMADAPVDKQMSSDKIITFAGQPDDMKALIEAALKRLDRNRAMQGKPKHETVDAMISSYVEEAAQAGLGWTREEAESEVVYYLRRQALADEGGIGGGGKGDGQDKAAFAMLGLLGLTGLASGLQSQGLLPDAGANPLALPPL